MKKTQERYVDGYVLVVPKKNVKAYTKLAKDAGKIWMKHGALEYKECIGDDLTHKWVTMSFKKMTNLKPTETVWFSFITYRSKAHRDQVNKKVMKDPFMSQDMSKSMPFDMKHMAFGGFKVAVDA